MSKIGVKPVKIPDQIQINLTREELKAQGPKGSLVLKLHPKVKVTQEQNNLIVNAADINDQESKALWGTYRALVNNIIQGVTTGFEKQLEINGTGYRASKAGNKLKLEVGYSHPVELEPPQSISFEVEKNIIKIQGMDKQLVGEWAAKIRSVRKVEPYKGKGIKYVDEYVKRKAGKKAVSEGG
ncbi:MAG: 50S ribosomal protein L6 [Candidatus Moranbacteria bacterium]|nr:50S ribosomal protein L6 [Candidatus Moranbacteria bacterium]